MVTYAEMWRHAMDDHEHNDYMTDGGNMTLGTISGMNIYFTQTSARMVQLLRDPNRNRINLLRIYEQDDMIDGFKQFVSKPLPNGQSNRP